MFPLKVYVHCEIDCIEELKKIEDIEEAIACQVIRTDFFLVAEIFPSSNKK